MREHGTGVWEWSPEGSEGMNRHGGRQPGSAQWQATVAGGEVGKSPRGSRRGHSPGKGGGVGEAEIDGRRAALGNGAYGHTPPWNGGESPLQGGKRGHGQL